MTLDPGTRLGHYVVGAPLGAGGMGEVYRASDTKLGRDVALKVLPADLARDPDRLARFQREARAVAGSTIPTSSRSTRSRSSNLRRSQVRRASTSSRWSSSTARLGQKLQQGGLPVEWILATGVALADAPRARRTRIPLVRADGVRPSPGARGGPRRAGRDSARAADRSVPSGSARAPRLPRGVLRPGLGGRGTPLRVSAGASGGLAADPSDVRRLSLPQGRGGRDLRDRFHAMVVRK